MGDFSRSVVFPSALPADAERLGQALLAWLVSERILGPQPSDCVLGAPLGHPPGSGCAAATSGADDLFLRLRTNGAEVVTERTVFDTGGLGFELFCPSCGAECTDLSCWGDAVGAWHSGAGVGELACPACTDTRPVTDWRHVPAVGFACLGLTFWNWPPLAEGFVQALADRAGYPALVVNAKL